jgi:hypothetical protein
MFRVLILSLKFINGKPDALEFMNIIVLHGNHQNAVATPVAIFRVLKTRVQICISILVFITLKMTTRVAETCR